MTDAVVVFARAPVPGAVKTRLARGVGEARALELYRWLGARVMAGLAGRGRGYRLIVAFTPGDAREAVAAWLPGADEYVAQASGDLGARMDAAIAEGLARGFDRVVIVGTDCLAVDERRVGEALERLREGPCVLGPAVDGGYYLVGATMALPMIFDDRMAWGTDAVLAATRARLRAAGVVWGELEVAQDIDTVDDLAALVGVEGAPAWVSESSR